MIINVKVKPGSAEDKIIKLSENSYLISTVKKAVDGKANLEVIKILAREFKTNYKNIKIKSPKSRRKIVEITI